MSLCCFGTDPGWSCTRVGRVVCGRWTTGRWVASMDCYGLGSVRGTGAIVMLGNGNICRSANVPILSGISVYAGNPILGSSEAKLSRVVA